MKLQITKVHIAEFLLANILPIAVIVLGIVQVANHMILNLSFLIGFVLLPLSVMSLYFLLIFCVRREWIKVTLGIVLIVSFIFDFFVVIFIGKFEELEHKNVTENVAEIPNHMWYMPDSSKMGHPKRIDYYKYYTSQIIFSDESMALICKYEEPDYIDQKAALEENYIFQSEPLVADEYSCEPTVELDGYVFRTLSVEEYLYKCDFPKTMIFIATNDATSEIVYLFFHSPDLDYVRELDHCINDYCGWKRMR